MKGENKNKCELWDAILNEYFMSETNKVRNTLLLIIWVYIDIDWHKMTSVADPNEEKFHFWVFASRPKRIWEKF